MSELSSENKKKLKLTSVLVWFFTASSLLLAYHSWVYYRAVISFTPDQSQVLKWPSKPYQSLDKTRYKTQNFDFSQPKGFLVSSYDDDSKSSRGKTVSNKIRLLQIHKDQIVFENVFDSKLFEDFPKMSHWKSVQKILNSRSESFRFFTSWRSIRQTSNLQTLKNLIKAPENTAYSYETSSYRFIVIKTLDSFFQFRVYSSVGSLLIELDYVSDSKETIHEDITLFFDSFAWKAK